MEELLAAIRLQSEMLAAIGDAQARIEMKQDRILLTVDALTTVIGEFCESINKLLTRGQEKEMQR